MITWLLNKLFPPKPISPEDKAKTIMWVRACVSGDLFKKKMDDMGYFYPGNTNQFGQALPFDLFSALQNQSFRESFVLSDETLLALYKNRYRRKRADTE